MAGIQGGSASIAAPDYWWYRARSELLQTVLQDFVHDPERLLDVGSADGPSVGWLRGKGPLTSIDLDPRGLDPGGVCASALALPFADQSFDVVAAFDVLEHCTPESDALSEFARVLAPGGRLLLSVPAYEWAWTNFDIENGHHRRYTRNRAVRAVEARDLTVDRATYAFATVFPFFAADRLRTRVQERVSRRRTERPAAADVVKLPRLSPTVERMLLGLSRVDRSLLRRWNLPFGSSVIVAARKGDRGGVVSASERDREMPEVTDADRHAQRHELSR